MSVNRNIKKEKEDTNKTQKKTKVGKKHEDWIKKIKKTGYNIHTSFSYAGYHLMKVISQITPWPIMQAVKSQTRKYMNGKERTGRSGKGKNKQGEGILRDDTNTYQEKEKEKTEGGKVWKRNDWKNRRQGLQKVNKVSGFLYRIIKKPKNYEALKGTQKHE